MTRLTAAPLPVEATTNASLSRLVDVLQEIADGLISADEGAARLGCGEADLAHLASIPEIERAFLAGSAQAKRDGQAIRRRAQALLLRLMARMSETADRLDKEDVPRAIDTVTRVLTAIDKASSDRETRSSRDFGPRLQIVLRNGDGSKFLTAWIGSVRFDSGKYDEAMTWLQRPSSEEPDPKPTPEHPARIELFRPTEEEVLDVDSGR